VRLLGARGKWGSLVIRERRDYKLFAASKVYNLLSQTGHCPFKMPLGAISKATPKTFSVVSEGGLLNPLHTSALRVGRPSRGKIVPWLARGVCGGRSPPALQTGFSSRASSTEGEKKTAKRGDDTLRLKSPHRWKTWETAFKTSGKHPPKDQGKNTRPPRRKRRSRWDRGAKEKTRTHQKQGGK